MKYIITLNNKKYEVTVERGNATAVFVDNVAAPTPAASAVAPQAAAPQAAAAAPAVPSGNAKEQVICPLPGTVLNVLVKEGDSVKTGDVLFVVEAMKMENDIPAPCDGVVSSITVSKGVTVDTGTVLANLS